MRIEHVAINVADPLAMARWYVEHLGFEVRRRGIEAPWGHFLVDGTGQTMIEIYGRQDVPVPDYRTQHPATLHLALVSEDVLGDAERLIRAGCQLEGQVEHQPHGDEFALLRDPWGLCLQLVKRSAPMLS